MTHFITVFQD